MLKRSEIADKSVTLKERGENEFGRPQYRDNKILIQQSGQHPSMGCKLYQP